jgi:hypothetical protein
MTKIFQRFDLDFKALESLLGVDVRKNLSELSSQGLEVLKDSRFAQATSVLRQRPVKKGYEVLESNDVYCGLHGSIILGGEIGKMDHKGDFYEIAGEFKMPYRSGSFYFYSSSGPDDASENPESLMEIPCDMQNLIFDDGDDPIMIN